MNASTSRILAFASVGIVALACTESSRDPVAPTGLPPSSVTKPGGPGSARDGVLYQARLAPSNDSKARGMVLIEVVGGHLTVTVHAVGLEASKHIPQHIHQNVDCSGGERLINLDQNLTLAGEAPGAGDAYPMSSPQGVVDYYASRPLDELRAAAGLGSVEELLAWLDLGNRNVHMHLVAPPTFPAMNCGEVRQLN